MARINQRHNGHRVPDFLVLGTAKAGTTSLATYLNAHPQIEIPRKESFFFNAAEFRDLCLPYPLQRPLSEIVATKEAYYRLFEQSQASMLGEVGTGYLYHYKKSIPLIRQTLGEQVKLIIVLRNPIDRAYSAYMHFRKDCFEEISFEEALEMEYYRKLQRWDFMWHYKAMGLYFEQVRAYIEAFPHVHVILYDQLQSDPKGFMKSLFEKLGLEHIAPEAGHVKNVSGEVRFPWFQKLITHENALKKAVRPIVRTTMSAERRSFIRKYIKTKNLKPAEAMSAQAREALAEFYKKDVDRLGELLGMDLKHWLNDNP